MRELMFMACLCSGAALAADPCDQIGADGTITCSITLQATASRVRAALSDLNLQPTADVYEIKITGRRGRCQEVRRKTRGIWRPFSFLALRCPTPKGWQEELLQSDDFTAYSSSWELRPDGPRTRVIYRIRTELKNLPNALVRRGTIAGAKQALVDLARRVVGVAPE